MDTWTGDGIAQYFYLVNNAWKSKIHRQRSICIGTLRLKMDVSQTGCASIDLYEFFCQKNEYWVRYTNLLPTVGCYHQILLGRRRSWQLWNMTSCNFILTVIPVQCHFMRIYGDDSALIIQHHHQTSIKSISVWQAFNFWQKTTLISVRLKQKVPPPLTSHRLL